MLCFEKHADDAHLRSAPYTMSPLQSGSTLGRYELLVRIGRGGMASVWVARERAPQSGRQRLVAVKAMLPELAHQSAFRSLFLEEGQLVRSINHENVVRVHDVGEVDGILYMTMEWVEGESLRNVIRAAAGRRPIPSEIAVQVVSDAAAGLHAAHELRGWDHELRGIVHCDVSPHNVLLGVDGRAKVLDFGVASAMGHLNAQGIKGKPGYMAPEQARGEPLDRRADVFALGIVLYELTTGAPFIPSRDREEALRLAAFPQIVRPSAVLADYPHGLEQVVLTALASSPDQRYQTAQELQVALQDYLVSERVMVSHAGVTRLLRKVAGQRIERRRELIAAVLQEMEGEVDQELLLQHPGLATSDLWDYQSDSKVSHNSAVTMMSATGPGPSSTPVASQTTMEPLSEIDADLGSGVPVIPNHIPLPPTRRGASTIVISVLVVVVACAALAVGFLLRGRVTPPTSSTGAAGEIGSASKTEASSEAASSASKATTLPRKSRGINIESLPLEGQSTRQAAGAPGASQPTNGSRTNAASPSKGNEPDPSDRKPHAPRRSAGASVGSPKPASIKLVPSGGESPAETAADPNAFNRGAASAALQRVAGSVVSCGKPGGPAGAGMATVTFSASGAVSSVRLPYKFADTDVGQCIDSRFRGAKVPPFKGGSVALSQSFQVN